MTSRPASRDAPLDAADARRTRRTVAIYQPQASMIYERGVERAGGAERQTHLLARALAHHGYEVAHITFPVGDLVDPGDARLTVIQRPPRRTNALAESLAIWRALRQADAEVQIVRTATPALGIVGLFCLARRRRVIFSSANDGDFTYETIAAGSRNLFRLGTRLSAAFVVQTGHQREVARRTFPRARRIEEIPSFVEPAPDDVRALVREGRGEGFLWIGRLVGYKQPLKYVELAEAVPEARFRMIGLATSLAPSMENEVRTRAAALRNLEILAPRTHAETLRLLAQSTALVSTSRLEGMPNVFLEAWSLGIPVVSLSFDPDGRIRRHGLGVIADGSWEDFVGAVRRQWRDPQPGTATAESMEAYLEATHSSDRVAAAWIALIEELR